MNDTLGQDLRVALWELAESRSTDAEARLCAVDYRPRSGRRRWPFAGLAAALAAGAAATVVLLSSAAPEAFAGWTAVPTTPTASALATATALCNALNPVGGRLTSRPVLTESRGRYTAAIYVTPSTGQDQICVSDGVYGDDGTSVSGGDDALRISAAPGPDLLGMPSNFAGGAPGFGAGATYKGQMPSWWSALTGHQRADQRATSVGVEQHTVGLAGRDVRSVTFVFDRSATVSATVENGWYFAWWPGAALPQRVEVTSSSGATASSSFPFTSSWGKACPQQGGVEHLSSSSSCGVFATGERPSAIRRERAWTKAHPSPSKQRYFSSR